VNILDNLGLTESAKVRYAIVALGDIAQEAMLPGIASTGNSEVVAFVSSDPQKAKAVGEQYGVKAFYNYDEFQELLDSETIDAVYLATPNWRHAEFAIPALKAGIHVLVEKPLEVSVEKCREILAAQRESTAKLMVAYRLHFEPATLDLIETIRSGELGDVHTFTSTFAQVVDPQNHRAQSGDLAGPILDMGPYPVNAARYVFGSEPIDVVSAVGTRHPQAGLGDFDDTVAVTLRFPEGRIAQFTISYYGNAIDTYCVLGTKGNVVMRPSYLYGKPLELIKTIGQKQTQKSFKNTDHFGGELKYFSDCILAGIDPEPDAEEGLADVRVFEGIFEALETGKSVTLPPFERTKRIDPVRQKEELSARKSPELVGVSNPGAGVEKIPKN
jgi:predicted dehydrogenase